MRGRVSASLVRTCLRMKASGSLKTVTASSHKIEVSGFISEQKEHCSRQSEDRREDQESVVNNAEICQADRDEIGSQRHKTNTLILPYISLRDKKNAGC